MSPSGGGAATLAGVEIFKRVALDVYELLKKSGRGKLAQWNTARKREQLYRKIAKVRMVKTIWQVDKAVDLSEFYCDSRVRLPGDSERVVVNSITDFGTKKSILVEGIAGQGKSIFLRYLCASELARGEYIPVFLELRRISPRQTLMDRIFAELEALGLKVDHDLFEVLAESGRLLLLLDAFDEVPEGMQSGVLTDIEDLLNIHERLQIVVSSRPDRQIRASRFVDVVELSDLVGDEYKIVLSKLAHGELWASGLIRHIETRAFHIRGLLCTPLMVTLLVLSYKTYGELPLRMSEFYDSLFQALLQRHDGTKPGFRRKRKCDLNDSQYRKVFEGLCVFAKLSKRDVFTAEKIEECAEKAIKETGVVAGGSKFVSDIVKTTCLIVREGDEFRYIHKSVQEYYAASFVRGKPDLWARAFYGRYRAGRGKSAQWDEEVAFLRSIDEFRWKKYCVLPDKLMFLGLESGEAVSKRRIDGDRLLDHVVGELAIARFERAGAFVHAANRLGREWRVCGERIADWLDGRRWVLGVVNGMDPAEWAGPAIEAGHGFGFLNENVVQGDCDHIRASALLEDRRIRKGLRSVVLKFAREVREEVRRIVLEIEVAESPSILDGLV
jgi:NACHT domain